MTLKMIVKSTTAIHDEIRNTKEMKNERLGC